MSVFFLLVVLAVLIAGAVWEARRERRRRRQAQLDAIMEPFRRDVERMMAEIGTALIPAFQAAAEAMKPTIAAIQQMSVTPQRDHPRSG